METRPAKEIWEAALGELQIQVNKPNYRTWLAKTVGLSYEDNQFVVGVPNTFVAEYLDQNQRSMIEKTLMSITRCDIKVQFSIDAKYQDSLGNSSARARNYIRRADTQQTQQMSLPLFNPKYTFDSFIVGNCNRLARAAALEVAKNPGHSYNPLFIYGAAGLGKTHLLHAIGHIAQASHMQVICVSAEQFTNEFVEALRQKKTREFRNRFRSVDMLLMDDIHFIQGKKQVEGSFFHTFNELHDTNCQIALTSDRPPKSLSLLEERLLSRLEWGLITDIQPPDFETRLAILRAKAEQGGTDITPDVLEFIAQRTQPNIRELEGSLNRVIAYARLTRAPPTTELAVQALKDIDSKSAKSASITPGLVIEAVADSFRLSPLDLKGPKRNREIVLARQVAMYLIRQTSTYSLARIGRELGERDHHIVSTACRKIANDITSNASLRDTILDIQRRIYYTKHL